MMPMRGIFPCCCARADRGQVAATPLNRVMNSRRLIGFVLKAVDRPYHTGGRKRRFALQRNMAAKVRDGSSRDEIRLTGLRPQFTRKRSAGYVYGRDDVGCCYACTVRRYVKVLP